MIPVELEGIRYLAEEGFRVLYSEGCHLHRDKTDWLTRPHNLLAEAATVADHSDAVILCLGLDERIPSWAQRRKPLFVAFRKATRGACGAK